MSTRRNYPIIRVYEAIGQKYDTRGATIPRSGRRSELRVICPVHLENSPSCDLDTEKNIWVCRSCNEGGDPVDMVIKSKTVDGRTKAQLYARAFAWLDALMGIPYEHATRPMPKPKFVTGDDGNLIQQTARIIYPYLNADGTESFQVLRIEGFTEDGTKGKTFRQRRRLPLGAWHQVGDSTYEYINLKREPVLYGPTDPTPIVETYAREPKSKFLYSTRGIHGILYNLPAVVASAQKGGTLFYAEGEKKSKTLIARAELDVTKAPGGATNPIDDINLTHVRGVKRMIILSDSDDVGRKGATLRRDFFAQAIDDILIVDFYGDNSHRDVDDWLSERPNLDPGQVRAELRTIVRTNAYR